MDMIHSLQEARPRKILQTLLFLGVFFLFVSAFLEYKGEGYIYVIFSVVSNILLYFGFRKNATFFDTFIGVFFWLGFWLKLTVRVAFIGSQFHEPVGNFDGSGAAFDQALLVTSCAFFGLLSASYIREKYLFVYPSRIIGTTQYGLSEFYKRYRMIVLIGFTVLFITVGVTNYYFGFYQRGTITRTILPFGLNGIYKWLLLFGFASFSALILRFEYTEAKKTLYLVAIISLIEGFVSNVSLLSRGMILNTSALVYGIIKGIKLYEIKSSFRFLITCFVIFIMLFGSSVILVNHKLRAGISSGDYSGRVSLHMIRNSTQVLLLDRWVGIEGVMAVSSYPDLGWKLWNEAWQETYVESRSSLYDYNLIDSPYKNADTSKHHYISLPGMVAFCFYPGSYLFLFFSMFIVGIGASMIEVLAFKLGGGNVVLCALLAQVVAFRYAHFGYVPAQSYLLFGSILLTIAMIYIANKLLVFWYKRKGTLNH